LRFQRTCGLDDEQLDELCARVEELLDAPWDKTTGRAKELSLPEAVVVTCAYMRHNIVQEVLAEFFDVDQAVISRLITMLTPLIARATEEDRPSSEEAKEAIKGGIALVDGVLWPCWSWSGHRELWAGKYGTTGHGGLVVSNARGDVVYVTGPAPGCDHDMRKLKESAARDILDVAGGVFADKGFQGSGYVTPVKKSQGGELLLREHDYNNQVSSFRAPVERAVANMKTWRILHTDYRRPLKTFSDSFKAAIGLYFFKLAFS
jgi:hypothetical protein